LETNASQRGKEEACPHCGTYNIVPGGEGHRIRYHTKGGHKRSEEAKEPLTLAKVLKTCLWALLAAATFGAVYYSLWVRSHGDPDRAAAEPFIPYLSEYCDIGGLKEAPPDSTRGTYIVGKAVVVNMMDDKTLEAFRSDSQAPCPSVTERVNGQWRGINWREFAKLPEDLRAAKPEDVEAIVWLEWSAQESAESTPKERRWRILCDVFVIDKFEGLIVGKTSVKGGRPPLPDVGSPRLFGSRPTRDITDYLSGCQKLRRDDWGVLVKPNGERLD
jgi:hypothetical protein